MTAEGGEIKNPETKIPLTSRQTEILKLAMSGLTYRDISKCLSISYQTVLNHLRTEEEGHGVFQKLGVSTIREAVVMVCNKYPETFNSLYFVSDYELVACRNLNPRDK